MNPVEAYYDEHAQEEWDRLSRYRMEFAVTRRALEDYLPPAPAKILDVGSGPGRYALALAQRGYTPTLADISTRELDLARQKAREAGLAPGDFVKIDGNDLAPFADESFDVVLVMGPLYHLLRQEERAQMVREARRVLKPAGLVFATFVTRYALLRDVVKHKPEAILARGQYWEHVLATGRLTGEGEVITFTDAYLVQPGEVRPLMEQGGFATLDLLGCEGLVSQLDEAVNRLSGEAWQAWVDLNYRVGKDPSLHGAADHLLYVGRKNLP